MATKEMSIKLMIDPESNRLIFAESSKDFVDFLIFLLALPIGTVTKLLSSESMVGSIGNIYKSIADLDETYLQPNFVNKNVILNPMVFSSAIINTPLMSGITRSSINSSRKFYTCRDPECKVGITNVADCARCPDCRGIMNQEIKFIDKDSQGYVQNVASYMVSDDLSITSISTMSIVSMLNKFNVTKPEERKVKIGTEEALELLKASLQSTTVLTDVFLKRKKRKQPDSGRRKKRICVSLQNGKHITVEVEASDTIGIVKAKIEDCEGFPAKYARLISDGLVLDDSRTIDDYNIDEESDIYHMLHQRGC